MKQTIISKCFSRMKRVALTLFAALCVGSVWAEEESPSVDENVQNVVDLNSSVFAISDKVYTGSALVSGLIETDAYTVEDIGGDRINVGEQKVRVTLKEGYTWSDGDVNTAKEFSWNITQSPNDWLVAPVLSPNSWPQALAKAGRVKFIAPQPSFGELVAEIASNGGNYESFNGTLPTAPGDYAIRYSVEGSSNWAAKEWSVEFTIYPSEDFDYGYRVFGLGANKDEVAVVFTKSGTWKVPVNIENAQFLVVGGGGGGGADCSDGAAVGGAGGGGGGVAVGEIDLSQNSTVSITVGAGGTHGKLETSEANGESSTSKYYGASKKGGNSIIKIGTKTYVTAYGGGRDRGVSAISSSVVGRVGGQGGSNGGSRGGYVEDQSSEPTAGKIENIAALSNCFVYGNKGGKGCSDNFWGYPSAGGGGGATTPGGDAGNAVDDWSGGNGGEGFTSSITGASLVYGSGGGGASTQGSSGGQGGTGAGNGGCGVNPQGTSAVANQGGGGGGSSREVTYGGTGGSGIVVIRYVAGLRNAFLFGCEPEIAMRNATANYTFVYNGQNQSVLPENFFNSNDWEINGVTNEMAIGRYSFTITPKRDLLWSDGFSGSKEFTWNIIRIDPSYGYIKEVEGDTIVVFTNQAVTATWVPDTTLKNIQFLAVGGGGGGGGAVRYNPTGTANDFVSPGGGGGGGGVVAGYITELKVDEPVNIKIGRGGTGGSASSKNNTGNGKVGTVAQDSWFGVGELRYVTACKGGSDKGYKSLQEAGASVAGMRFEVGTETEKTEGGILGDGAPLKDVYMSSGGASGVAAGTKTKNGAGGGGGAMGDGANANDTNGGKGGAGYKSSITGTELDYGSGGGGGGGGGINGGAAGDTGAGAGANSGKTGSSAKANRGGGGGGGGVTLSSAQNGGAGGSGIVVFRYNKYPAGVVAADGIVYYETLDAAIAAAQEDETIKLFADVTVDSYVVIPEGRMLDLNGKSIQARAVVGKLTMNGGALKTYDTNTQTYFFMAAPAQTAGALYWTSDAVLTIEQDYDLVLESGSVTLPNSWRTLVGQSLTIASGAEFIIPENVTLNLRGNAVVAEDAKLTCNGTIALGNSLDTVDTTATLTIGTELESNKIVSAVYGYVPVYNEGTYSLVLAKVYVAEVGGVKYTSLVDAIGAANGADVTLLANIELVSSYVTITADTTINLAGNNITSDGDVFIVEGGTLTVNGEGKITANTDGAGTACALWANGGNAVINGGTWSCGGDYETTDTAHQNDTIYTKNGGKVTITGGTFEYTANVWTLNENDKNRKTITVSGGKFKNFNPADNTSEGPKTNFCADGYAAELNNEGYYVVAKLAIAPNDTTEVTASSPDDAASKVTILVPAAMKDVVTADKYAEYFVKSAEYNASTGKYTVTAALKPDVVKPVIAKTTPVITFKDGTVTVNIENKLPGLYYGVRYATTVEAVETTAPVEGFTVTPKAGDTAGFFKVVVDFKEIK